MPPSWVAHASRVPGDGVLAIANFSSSAHHKKSLVERGRCNQHARRALPKPISRFYFPSHNIGMREFDEDILQRRSTLSQFAHGPMASRGKPKNFFPHVNP